MNGRHAFDLPGVGAIALFAPDPFLEAARHRAMKMLR
jgi:hypothetical protein